MPGYLLPAVMGQYVALKKPLFSETDSSYPSTTSVCYNAWYMKEEQRLYQERIVADPRILAGKPVVKGTRIGVDLVLEELSHNPDIHELLAAHPDHRTGRGACADRRRPGFWRVDLSPSTCPRWCHVLSASRCDPAHQDRTAHDGT